MLESKIWALGVLTCFFSPSPAPSPFFFFPFKIYLFIHWLWWLPIAVRGLSLVLGSRAPFPCSGFSCWGAQVLGTRASVVAAPLLSSVACGLSCSLAWGIFPDQGWSRCPLHCKLDSWRSPSFFQQKKVTKYFYSPSEAKDHLYTSYLEIMRIVITYVSLPGVVLFHAIVSSGLTVDTKMS